MSPGQDNIHMQLAWEWTQNFKHSLRKDHV